jgi:hypothetical protein
MAGEGKKMEVEPVVPTTEDEEEDYSDLADLLEPVDDAAKSVADKFAILMLILLEPSNRYNPSASAIKERMVTPWRGHTASTANTTR